MLPRVRASAPILENRPPRKFMAFEHGGLSCGSKKMFPGAVAKAKVLSYIRLCAIIATYILLDFRSCIWQNDPIGTAQA